MRARLVSTNMKTLITLSVWWTGQCNGYSFRPKYLSFLICSCVFSENSTQALTAISCMHGCSQPGRLFVHELGQLFAAFWSSFLLCDKFLASCVCVCVRVCVCECACEATQWSKDESTVPFLERGSPRLFLCGSSLGHTSTRCAKYCALYRDDI